MVHTENAMDDMSDKKDTSSTTVEEVWLRVFAKRPEGCYHIRFVASDNRTLEIIPSYEGWSSVLTENCILPGMLGRGIIDYALSIEEIMDFPVEKTEFLFSAKKNVFKQRGW